MKHKTLLFCIPYAGGSSTSMSNVANVLNSEDLEVHYVELPGRGMRSEEPFHSTLEETIEDISAKIKSTLQSTDQPFILWGHSMGSVLSLLVSFKIQEDYNCRGLIVSGMRAPLFKSTKKPLSREKRNALLVDILPTKYERSKNAPLFQRVQQKRIEIMEKDVALLEENPVADWSSVIIKSPLAVIIAEDDELYDNKDCYLQWNHHTSSATSYFPVKGGHFFMFQYPSQTSALIKTIINDLKY